MELAGALHLQAHTLREVSQPATHVAVIMQEEQVCRAIPASFILQVELNILSNNISPPAHEPCPLLLYAGVLPLPGRPLWPAPPAHQPCPRYPVPAAGHTASGSDGALRGGGACGTGSCLHRHATHLRTAPSYGECVDQHPDDSCWAPLHPVFLLDTGRSRPPLLVHRLWLRGTPLWGATPGRWQSAW